MNKVKLNDVIKTENIIIPTYLFGFKKKFNLTLEEFFILNYLISKKFKLYDAPEIAEELGLDINYVSGLMSKLQQKDLLLINLKEIDGIIEEEIILEPFYDKLKIYLINQFTEKEENDTTFLKIKNFFGRDLNSTEIEIIKSWEDKNVSLDLIEYSIKEAEKNNVKRINYIDKIIEDKTKKEEELEKTLELFNNGEMDDWF